MCCKSPNIRSKTTIASKLPHKGPPYLSNSYAATDCWRAGLVAAVAASLFLDFLAAALNIFACTMKCIGATARQGRKRQKNGHPNSCFHVLSPYGRHGSISDRKSVV